MVFLNILLNVLVFVLVLGAIIFIHELGHFIAAKKFNILCHEFALGMGPQVVKKKKGETVYALRAIPIGGFVSMAGEDLNEAMIRKDQIVSLTLNENNDIKEIIIDDAKESAIKGRVVDYELYGSDMAPLFIEIELENGVVRYNVLRDAMYVYGKQKEIQITPAERSFEHQKGWKRFIVLFAGAGMNFVLAFFLFLIAAAIIGKPQTDTATIGQLTNNFPAKDVLQIGDVITHIEGEEIFKWDDIGPAIAKVAGKENITIKFTRDGIENTVTMTPVVTLNSIGISNYDDKDKVVKAGTIIGTAGANAGGYLYAGDKILGFKEGNVLYPVTSWFEIVEYIKSYNRAEITVVVERTKSDETIEEKTVTFEAWTEQTLNSQNISKIQTAIGISPVHKFNFWYMFKDAGTQFGESSIIIFKTLGLLFSNSQIGLGDLSGPVGIFNVVGSIMMQGFVAILVFAGLLCVNVGIVNLLPIPAFDGGRILFLGIEAIRRKPLNKKVENTINNVMFILLMLLLVYITFNDILRLF